MMTLLAVANSDLLTILPAQWLHLPPASPNIVVFPFRERLHAAPICLVHRADLSLTPLAGAFYDMVQKAGAKYQLPLEEIGRRYQMADQATGHSKRQQRTAMPRNRRACTWSTSLSLGRHVRDRESLFGCLSAARQVC